jgi:peptidoglycan/LPS O-acetylase OafA/YrhL
MKYRAEIDGLRALAVLPVILFHAGFEWFSGGFVGVDVFFVISGYLITTIIISEMAEGKFSIVNFYERRARRILPALFFVMLACLPFAWLWLTPSDLKDFGQSLVAVSTFSSNILFWWESGYFDTAAELKPLLHTWSLAVEEQYYILFPVFLMLTWRLGIKTILILLSIVFLISLGVAVWGTQYAAHPKIISGAFFLLPTRGWELLIGVFAAFYLKYNTHLKSHTLNQMLSLLGFGMIAYSIIAFDKTTPFPSLYALIPTIGTGLLILCAVPKTFVHRLLSLKYIVGIGLISYSAYLWHQPLLAFARHRLLGDVSDSILILLCSASLLMAWLSWKFVEAPFRSNRKITRNAIFCGSFCSLIIFLIIGYLTHKNININSEWSTAARQHQCLLQSDEETQHSLSCYEDDSGILLWGDSHAGSLSIGLAESYSGRTPFTQLTQSGCPPILGLEVLIHRKSCNQINQRILDDIKKSDYRKVILHAAWVHYDYPMTAEKLREKIGFTLNELQTIEGMQIVIIGNVPRWQSNPFQIAKFESELREIKGIKYYRDDLILDVDEIMLDLQKKYKFRYFSPIRSVCIYENNIRYCPLSSKENLFYIDWGHLSRPGSKHVVSSLGQLFSSGL